jgi:hypothetical protein
MREPLSPEKIEILPPCGWPMFESLTKFQGIATYTETDAANSRVLQYNITLGSNGVYGIEIMDGKIGYQGISFSPGIGIRFFAKEYTSEQYLENAVLEMHLRGQRLMIEREIVLRGVLAITYIISRIDQGLAPHLKRVFKIYNLS